MTHALYSVFPYAEPTEASKTKADWISSLPLPRCEKRRRGRRADGDHGEENGRERMGRTEGRE